MIAKFLYAGLSVRHLIVHSIILFPVLINANYCSIYDPVSAVDVVIVGAGIAGISAYRELKLRNPSLSVIILEATDRIGGRMRQANIGGYSIEKGANWLHSRGTEFWKLAQKNLIKTSETVYRDIIVYNSSKVNLTPQFNRRINRIQRKSDGAYYRTLKAAKQYWDGTTDLYDGSEDVMDVMNGFGYLERTELDAFVRWMLIDFEFGFANIALLNYDGFFELLDATDSESFVVDQRGYKTILDRFISENRIPDPRFNVKVTDIIYSNNAVLDNIYKVLVQGVDKNQECVQYKAKRSIVTVPVNILRGQGYAINFSPSLKVENLASITAQYNKVFYKFNTRFWDGRNFIGIIREPKFRGVCNHWHNVDFNLPGSKILMCTLTNEGMDKVVAMNLTASDLLQPLRDVYGSSVVDKSLQESVFSRFDLDPATGYGAYASIHSGLTINKYYKFWGGQGPNGFVKGEGYNSNGEWVVFFSGAASCFEYNEQVDGAYYSGQRSARYLLRSLGSTIAPITACENF